MDFRPVPPSGKVEDLRNQQPKTEETIAQEKQARNDKVRRNLRLFALVLAGYYFISAGYSWYEESQRDAAAQHAVINAQNPLKDPVEFRKTFNQLLTTHDTSLPTANANDSTTGFIAVLSTTVEIQGYAKPNSHELQEVQIQTRYPDAFPPESIVAFRTFVYACESLADSKATQNEADYILNELGITPRVDANEDDKHFANTSYQSRYYKYSTVFTKGPIDELTLMATPLANMAESKDSASASAATASETNDVPVLENADTKASAKETADMDVNAHQNEAANTEQTSTPAANSSDVPQLEQEHNSSSDVPLL